ncbi:hemagglutinin/hemolysin-like protein [Leifsonia xyli subsp. cynodontis DSM 46306]|uniref:RNA polymerase subunit sigma-70 n=1 Tax=Leifsonia xyli subsp. cynodontis DSM 46306 TaxID=1389489 RepID=U3P771_LEIXC|nr:hemagglutinin/hemolysin-like protein [Leifsonia xyli subsp. cynodontis DSM 46306]
MTDLSDADLVDLTRSGDSTAFGELWRRHARAGRTVAHGFTSIDADDLVAEAYAKIFHALSRGHGPIGSFRAYLFTTVRNVASTWGRRTARETPIDDTASLADPAFDEDYALAELDRSLTAQAFRSLPSRWQEVLWYCEVEAMKPADVAPLLGMSASAVAALAYRAREGLRQAWVQAHIANSPEDSECRWATDRLGAYARNGLGKRDTAKIESHLADCARCAIVAEEAKDIGSRLALVLLPLAVGVGGTAAYTAWAQTGANAVGYALGSAGAALPGSVTVGATAAGTGAAGGSAGTGSAASSGTSSAGGAAMSGMTIAGLTAGGALLAAAVAGALILGPGLFAEAPGAAETSPPPAAQEPSAPKPSAPRPREPEPATPPNGPAGPAEPTAEPPTPATTPPAPVSTPAAPPLPAPAQTPTADPAAAPLAARPDPLSFGSATRMTTAAFELAFAGTAVPGATVELRYGDILLGTTTASPDGSWAAAFPIDRLANGTWALSLVQVVSGAASAPVPIEVVVDRRPPAPTIAVDTGSGYLLPIVSGTAEPGATVEVFDRGSLLATVTTGDDGRWGTDPLGTGASFAISARSSDSSGVVSAASETISGQIAVPSVAAETSGTVFSVIVEGVPGREIALYADGKPSGHTGRIGDDGVFASQYEWRSPGDHRIGFAYTADGRHGVLAEAPIAITRD